jgi:predicted nucleic acid-binding protein
MAGTAYVDSSALLKLAVREPETAALEADLAQRDGLLASRLDLVECRRAALRAPHRRVLQSIDQILETIYLIEMTPAILDAAAAADPPTLRSIDAIRVATALSIGDAGMEVITYDGRFDDAARANGLIVVHPVPGVH